jgi:hypothetical protein
MDGIVREALAEGAAVRADLIAAGRLNPEELEKSDADGPAAFVDAIQSEGLIKWGFVVVRTDFEDEGKWERFKERWEEAMEDQMMPSYGMGIEEVKGNLEMMWVEEKSLDGADAAAVRRYGFNFRLLGGR